MRLKLKKGSEIKGSVFCLCVCVCVCFLVRLFV